MADVARAFFEAQASRNICVELPEKNKNLEDIREDRVGWLQMSLYGTRDAAQNWQEEVARQMKKWGFKRGVYNPCLYLSKDKKAKVLVHGDDFAALAEKEAIRDFKRQLEERFEGQDKDCRTRSMRQSDGD